MEPTDSILINVNIDNRALRLRVAVKDEEDVRLSAQVLNQRVNP
jgi:phosphotransferase system IIB component